MKNYIIKYISVNTKQINLSGNKITDLGMKYITKKLSNSQILILDHLYITDKGLKYITNKLLHIKQLNISYNYITYNGIINLLSIRSKLISLNAYNVKSEFNTYLLQKKLNSEYPKIKININ